MRLAGLSSPLGRLFSSLRLANKQQSKAARHNRKPLVADQCSQRCFVLRSPCNFQCLDYGELSVGCRQHRDKHGANFPLAEKHRNRRRPGYLRLHARQLPGRLFMD